ncbi:hypothetical protein NL676_029861 [Syzygium grande]|nr:hypothetical protein NL676_029861 [Syzygium grande]
MADHRCVLLPWGYKTKRKITGRRGWLDSDLERNRARGALDRHGASSPGALDGGTATETEAPPSVGTLRFLKKE